MVYKITCMWEKRTILRHVDVILDQGYKINVFIYLVYVIINNNKHIIMYRVSLSLLFYRSMPEKAFSRALNYLNIIMC